MDRYQDRCSLESDTHWQCTELASQSRLSLACVYSLMSRTCKRFGKASRCADAPSDDRLQQASDGGTSWQRVRPSAPTQRRRRSEPWRWPASRRRTSTWCCCPRRRRTTSLAAPAMCAAIATPNRMQLPYENHLCCSTQALVCKLYGHSPRSVHHIDTAAVHIPTCFLHMRCRRCRASLEPAEQSHSTSQRRAPASWWASSRPPNSCAAAATATCWSSAPTRCPATWTGGTEVAPLKCVVRWLFLYIVRPGRLHGT